VGAGRRGAVGAGAGEKAGAKSSNGSESAHGHSHGHGGHHVHSPLATSKRRSGSKSRDVDLSSSHAASASTSTSTDGAGTLDGTGAQKVPRRAPWPAAFHAALYAQVWCTYRAGFEPICDLPPLASLPPPLFFPNAQSRGHGSSGTVVPRGHAQTLTSPRMQHSPLQSDSSHSSAMSSSWGWWGWETRRQECTWTWEWTLAGLEQLLECELFE
jgi:hypothetical protein